MIRIGIALGRLPTPLVVASLLLLLILLGNDMLLADAFQVTKFCPPSSYSSSKLVPRQHLLVEQSGTIPSRRRTHGTAGDHRLFVATTTTVVAVNNTSPLPASIAAALPKTFLPQTKEELQDFKEAASGRKRRAIRKMREKIVSRPIESRLARTLLFPARILVWKPLWMVVDTCIGTLDENGDTTLGSVNIANTSEKPFAASTALHVASLSPRKAAAKANLEDSVSSEPSRSHSERINTSVTTLTETLSNDVQQTQIMSTTQVVEQSKVEEKKISSNVAASSNDENCVPLGDRWAVAAPGIDLSGKWELIVTDDFKKNYDKYLAALGQPKIVRSVALSGPVIGQTMEEIIQTDHGRSFLIRGKNVRGTWDRTLEASGSSVHSTHFEPLVIPIPTVDQELVDAEAWWEDEGTVHVSWMRGVTMYGGGSFYSRRYFEEKEHEEDETVYACEGFFEFNNPKKPNNELTWRFRRQTK